MDSDEHLEFNGIKAPVAPDFVRRPTAPVDVDENIIIVEGEEKMEGFIVFLCFVAGLSGTLFGYDTGVISGALVLIGSDLGPEELSNSQKEVITSMTTVGALFGSLVSGLISDRLGRKWTLAIADLFFIIGAAIIAASFSMAQASVGRLLLGLGVGSVAALAPLYIGELAPMKLRGRLVTINSLCITMGQLLAYAIGAAFNNVPHGWRWMVAIGIQPSILQLVLMHLLPESPRYLLTRNVTEGARNVLRKIYRNAPEDQIDLKLRVLEHNVEESLSITRTTTPWERIKMFKIPVNRRALIVACGLQAYQQLSGFNSLMYYSATIFKSLGFDNAAAAGLIVAGANFVFTCVGMVLVDRVGRRRLMLITGPGMNIDLVGRGCTTGGLCGHGCHALSRPIRAASPDGAAIATATCWTANLVISVSFLSLMEAATPSGAFGLYCSFCLIGYIHSFRWRRSRLSLPKTSELRSLAYFARPSGTPPRRCVNMRPSLARSSRRRESDLLIFILSLA